MTNITFKLVCPRLPNFIKIEDLDSMMPVEDLSDEQLIKLADEWKQKLLDHAARRRASK
jgi:hypothetical protein